ncbi:MAG: hypothetical protein RSG79_19695 [Pseudomonas sp.]
MPLTKSTMVAVLLLIALLTGCTTQLTNEGAKVSLVTAPKASACDVIDVFKVQGGSADDALNLALNQAAEMGGNGLGVESVNEVGGDSEVNGVALKCRR